MSTKLDGDRGEFALIRQHFQWETDPHWEQVKLGVGDDCALLKPRPGHVLAISSDMLVQGRHFFADVAPARLGHKALAVNLSDLAAMGARPLGFTLALALPDVDHAWLAEFSAGLRSLAVVHGCPLVGGDTTRGPLNLCITVFGECPEGLALRRQDARVGDDLYLSGTVGEARLALECLMGTPWALAHSPAGALETWREKLECPQPRLALGQALLGIAHAAIDLSDGLAGDLGHVLRASGFGADIEMARLPVPHGLQSLAEPHRQRCLLHGGDDYELLFTAPPENRERVQMAAERSQTPVHRIGHIRSGSGLRLLHADGRTQDIPTRGFDHFI